MTSQTTESTLTTRLVQFIKAFETSPADYLFDNIQHAMHRLNELEARVARLENSPVVTEAPKSAVTR